MRLSKGNIRSLLFSTISSLTLIGCGGGGSSSSPSSSNSEYQTGTFVDAPVKGLYYKTDSYEGYTNDKGEFNYKLGENVEFKLGDLSLGTVEASGLITPYTLANTTSDNGNDLSTNIALLLQNLDEDRSDDILDVEKLKDHKFTGFNLSVTKETMETLISNKLTSGEFNEYVKNKTLLDINTVNSALETNVKKEEKDILSPQNIIGKTYKLIETKGILGLIDENITFSFSDNELKGTSDEGTFLNSYIIEDNLIKITWEGDGDEYIKILSFSNKFVSVCVEENKETANSCTIATDYYISPSYVSEFIKIKSTSSENSLDKKTLVTNFSELENKYFYQINRYNNTNYREIIKISNGKLNKYWTNLDDNDLSDNNSDNTFDVSFSNNRITISGEDEEMNYPVYNYDLTNKNIKLSDFGHESLFDDEELTNDTSNKSISFTSGNMYCSILWWECWLDEIAMSQIVNQLGGTFLSNTQEDSNNEVSNEVKSPSAKLSELKELISKYTTEKTSELKSKIENFDTSNITDMSYLFYKKEFNLDISNWDTSSVTTMKRMFALSESFNQDISGWDTSKVTSMNNMFSYANKFNQDISNWDVSKVTGMDRMFEWASTFNQDISGWDTSKVTSMDRMFLYTFKFNQDISNWDVSKVISYEDFTNITYEWTDDKKPKFE